MPVWPQRQSRDKTKPASAGRDPCPTSSAETHSGPGPRRPRAWYPRPPGGALRLRMGRRWRSRSGDQTPAGKGGRSRHGPHRRLGDFGFDLPGDELIPRYNRLPGDRKNGCSAICVAMGTIAGGARAWKNTAFVGSACHSPRAAPQAAALGPPLPGLELGRLWDHWRDVPLRRVRISGCSPLLGRTLSLTHPVFCRKQSCYRAQPTPL